MHIKKKKKENTEEICGTENMYLVGAHKRKEKKRILSKDFLKLTMRYEVRDLIGLQTQANRI